MFKQSRLHHTRKDSRLHTITDHFNRLMEISDPLVAMKLHERSQSRMRNEKKDVLPEDALSLLHFPSAENITTSIEK